MFLNATTHTVIYFQLNLEGAKIWSKLEKLHLSHNSIKVVCIIVIDSYHLYKWSLPLGLIQCTWDSLLYIDRGVGLYFFLNIVFFCV